jgi:hypothetical protein
MIPRKKTGIEIPRSEPTRLEDPSVALRRDETERDSDEDREEPGCERELDRGRETTLDLLDHRLARLDAVAEVAGDDRVQVGEVLDVDRLVETVLLLDLGDRGGGRAFAEERLRRPAGQRPDPPEDQDRQAEEDRDEE